MNLKKFCLFLFASAMFLTVNLCASSVCSLDNCEDGDIINNFGGYWFSFASGNGAVVSPSQSEGFRMASGGYNSNYSAAISGTVGTALPDYPMAGLGTQFAPGSMTSTGIDISGCTGIRFYAKGDGKTYRIQLPDTDQSGGTLTGFNDYNFAFIAPASWSLFDIPFITLTQQSAWGTMVPLNDVLKNSKFIQWVTNFYADSGTTSFALWVDNIELYGCASCPAGTPAITPPTFTATPTPANIVPACLVDDCEDNDITNKFGGFWYSFASGNGAVVNPSQASGFHMASGGFNSNYSAAISGMVGTMMPDFPMAGLGTQFAPGSVTGTGMDISGCTGIRFYVKGDGNSYRVQLPYSDQSGASLTGFNDFNYVFAAPTTWSQLTIPFTILTQQAGWGTAVQLNNVLKNSKSIQWITNFYATSGTMSLALWVDNVELYGCASCPVVTPGITVSVTVTPTFTATPTMTRYAPSCLVDDCEDNNATNNFGGFWYTFASGNGAVVNPSQAGGFHMTSGGYNSLFAAAITGTVGTTTPDYPVIGLGTQFVPGSVTRTGMDLSGCTGIRFYTKGDGKTYKVVLPDTDSAGATLTNFDDYNCAFIAPAGWSQFVIPFTSFTQGGWGIMVPLNTVLKNAKDLQWMTTFFATSGIMSSALWIDNVELYGCASCPVVTPGITVTAINTPVLTVISTATPVRTLTQSVTPTVTKALTAHTTATMTTTASITPTATRTPAVYLSATKTVTATVTITGTVVVLPTATIQYHLRLQMASDDINLNTKMPKPKFAIFNDGTNAIALSRIEIRYWYQEEGNSLERTNLLWAARTPSMLKIVQGNFGNKQNRYLSVTFGTGAGQLTHGQNATVQAEFNKSDWSAYNQGNDWSFINSSAYVNWNKAGIYVDGQLVAGVLPGMSASEVSKYPVEMSGFAPLAKNNTFNYPNPASKSTSIRFSLAKAEDVEIIISDSNGTPVWTRNFPANDVKPGINSFIWNLKNDSGLVVANGVYIMKVSIIDCTVTNKIVIIK